MFAALALPVGAVGIPAAGSSDPEPMVRVLLLETEDFVSLQGGDRATRVEPAADGLLVDAQSVGPIWRFEAEGVVRAGTYRVRGSLEVRRLPTGLQVVNRVGLEDYVAGTLGREILPGWEREMFKAQAVVARSYALHRRAGRSRRPFDLKADTSGQVYGGVDAETPSVLAAVRATRGEYLSYDGDPILAVYHSASGGRTASAEEVWGRDLPYLVSMPVEGEEDSPHAYWRASVSRTTLGRALASLGIRVGSVRELRVEERSPSGRARRILVSDAEVSRNLDAGGLRSALGARVIRSTLFEIRTDGDHFVFVGSGYGHGVGMSQWGGQAMAKRGAGYREILAAFYPGTELRP
ncbi:MAG: SpoIID/LytB domain-containing protein [Myxococcota bacterium]